MSSVGPSHSHLAAIPKGINPSHMTQLYKIPTLNIGSGERQDALKTLKWQLSLSNFSTPILHWPYRYRQYRCLPLREIQFTKNHIFFFGKRSNQCVIDSIY